MFSTHHSTELKHTIFHTFQDWLLILVKKLNKVLTDIVFWGQTHDKSAISRSSYSATWTCLYRWPFSGQNMGLLLNKPPMDLKSIYHFSLLHLCWLFYFRVVFHLSTASKQPMVGWRATKMLQTFKILVSVTKGLQWRPWAKGSQQNW